MGDVRARPERLDCRNLDRAVVVHALYVCNGKVAQAHAYLQTPGSVKVWSVADDEDMVMGDHERSEELRQHFGRGYVERVRFLNNLH